MRKIAVEGGTRRLRTLRTVAAGLANVTDRHLCFRSLSLRFGRWAPSLVVPSEKLRSRRFDPLLALPVA